MPRPAAQAGEALRLALRAAPGSKVELLADWTGWEPRSVPETERGIYSLDVRLPAGNHRFLFRVDGEWRVPEGYPTERDEFGGRRAVVRVRST